MNATTILRVVAAGALGIVVWLGASRFGWVGAGRAASAEDMLPWLVAMACLCVVGLSLATHPSRAWLATILALVVATIDLATIARVHRWRVGDEGWLMLAAGVAAAAILASSAAIAYAAEPGRRLHRWIPGVGIVALIVIAAASARAIADPSPVTGVAVPGTPLGSLGVVTRSFIGTVLVFVTLGSLGELRPAAGRTRYRVAVSRPDPSSVADWISYVSALVRTFVAEAGPWRTRAHRAAIDERSRIARQLHADVVPAVRHAITEAERNGSAERLAAALREILVRVDAAVQAQHAIQLDVGGLVPAIEWLAERTEERSGVRVTIDVISLDDAGGPPKDVASAAYRVTQLALENVVRHAPEATVRIEIEAHRASLHLVISDDGPGLPVAALRTASVDGRRGLVDMVTEASGCGATLRVGAGEGGAGTCVEFAWRAP